MNFELRNVDDESIEFLIDGEVISYANHDSDGWVGMEKLIDMFTAIAKKFGYEVGRTEDSL